MPREPLGAAGGHGRWRTDRPERARLVVALARVAVIDVDPLALVCSLIDRARRAAADDQFLTALVAHERDFLREAFDVALDVLATFGPPHRRLHGEPHGRNRFVTANGLRWLDFESACTGPGSQEAGRSHVR